MLTLNAPPDLLVRRFAAGFQGLTHGHPDDGIGLAVSGGPDSVALLLLAHAAFPGRVEAATVDHGLRKASAAEARFVADLCGKLDIVHATLTIPQLSRGNVSAQAREARYDALDAWRESRKLDWLLTAHHADDQLETVVMRLNRGAGVGGLSGVRARRGAVVRPLLHWRRAELVDLVIAAGVRAVDDPTNRDDRFDRARLRKELANADWIDPVAVARSAMALDEADQALDWMTIACADAALERTDGAVVLDPEGYPNELLRRLVLRALGLVDPACRPRGPALDRLMAVLRSGRVATLGRVLCKGSIEKWSFSLAPPRRNPG